MRYKASIFEALQDQRELKSREKALAEERAGSKKKKRNLRNRKRKTKRPRRNGKREAEAAQKKKERAQQRRKDQIERNLTSTGAQVLKRES